VTFENGELFVLSMPLEPPELPADLTPAEREVVTGLLQGRTYAEIAGARGTSARTIANQVASAFRRLGVRSRGELAARCLSADRTAGTCRHTCRLSGDDES
jgi:DNA-binding CsgD family transcriptional regulator